MATAHPPRHYPGEATGRPKGILKNSSSNQRVPQTTQNHDLSTIPTEHEQPFDTKEITLANTLQNAGRRRSSVDAAHRLSSSSRRSSSTPGYETSEEANQRLKWDEANLYLAEQNRTATMKITEPKTPYAKQYDPAEDDADMIDQEEDHSINVDDVVVDEKDSLNKKSKKSNHYARESDIPGLELGEPEEAYDPALDDESNRLFRSDSREGSRSSGSEKHVSVGSDDEEQPVGMPTKEEAEKHKKFEEMRKRHYEMRDVKGLLGHPEELDAMEEDDDGDDDEEDEVPKAPPPMPALPSRFANGGSA